MNSVPPLRTLIVDDSSEFLGQLEKWLVTRTECDIVGKAYSGPEAVAQSRALRPDLVIMDVAMPQMNGYEATKKIKEGASSPTVILISFYPINEAYEEGHGKADAFLSKDSLYQELLPMVARLFPLRREQSQVTR